MKFSISIISLFCFFSCVKKEGVPIQNITTLPTTPIKVSCETQSNSIVTYNNSVKKILDENCLPCHSMPGSGGINLDSYSQSKATTLSGQLMPVVVYSPGNTFMPPPPQRSLDSCEIKALNLWIKQGCLLN